MWFEQERGGEFRFTSHGGAEHVLPDPADMGLVEVFDHIDNPFLLLAAVPADVKLSLADVNAIGDAWMAHYGLVELPQAERLLDTLHRYGKAVEADLCLQGVDLRVEFQARRWRHLLSLIDHLPSHSYLSEARAEDPELAAAYLDAELRGEIEAAERSERFAEYSPEVRRLAGIEDWLQAIHRLLTSAHGGNPSTFRPASRPQSAMEQARERRRIETNRALVKRLVPERPAAETADDLVVLPNDLESL